MTYKTLLLLPALLCSLFLFAQGKRYIYFVDEHMNICTEKNAVFTAYGNGENNLFKLLVASNTTKKPVSIEYFTDSALNTSQGPCEIYFVNGMKKEQGNYENNKENGDWKKWDSTGQMTDSLNYNMGVITDSTTFHYDSSGNVTAVRFTDIKNNTMHETDYNDSSKVIEEIFFKGQKGVDKKYVAGAVHTDSLYTRDEIDAAYPGGNVAFTKYITQVIGNHFDEIVKDNRSGTCLIKFIVDKNGNVSNMQATTMINTKLAQIAMDAVKKSPKWKPATEFGRPVNAYRIQPVTFTIQ